MSSSSGVAAQISRCRSDRVRAPPQISHAAANSASVGARDSESASCLSRRLRMATKLLPVEVHASIMPSSAGKGVLGLEIGAHGAATHETRAQASRALAREEEAREDEEGPRAPAPRAAGARARR